jgi:DNA-binding NtrC family response regulator
VGRRLGDADGGPREVGAALEGLSRELGRSSLKSLVSRTVELIERRLVTDALELTEGNRTAAAELLGLSRQGLYTKLARYGIDDPDGE